MTGKTGGAVAVQNVDAISELEAGLVRSWPGGLAAVPDDAPVPPRSHTEALTLLTTMAERIADLDLDGMLADISGLLGATAALVSRDGAHLAGDRFAIPSPEQLRAATRTLAAGRSPQPFGETILPVRDTSGAVLAYLCLGSGEELLPDEIWPMLGALLGAAAAVGLDRRDHARRAEGDFLLSLMFAGDDFPDAELVRWARQLDVDLTTPTRTAFLNRIQASNSRPLEQSQRLREVLTTIAGRALLADVADGIVCLCADPALHSSRHWVRAWERILPALTDAGIGGVTVGGAFTGVAGVRRSYRQARALAERQRSTGRVLAAHGVRVYEAGGLTEIVLGHPDSEQLQAHVRRVLGPLLDDPRFGGELAETLQAYLAAGGSPAGAAEVLHLHPSSVKYRMRVIRELLGGNELDDHDRRFELELALRMFRALEDLDRASRPSRTNDGSLSSRRADVAASARP